jgi:hypothetical protein
MNDNREAPDFESLPAALESWLRERFPDPTVRRRALVAPLGGEVGRTLWRKRELWHPEDEVSWWGERLTLERRVSDLADSLALDKPFFPAEGTGGTLRSPYAALSDAEYWMFYALYGSAEKTHYFLAECIYIYLGKTVLEHLVSAGPEKVGTSTGTLEISSVRAAWRQLESDQSKWSRARANARMPQRGEVEDGQTPPLDFNLLPPILRSLLEANFPDPVMRRRVLLAPQEGDVRKTLWQMRDRWHRNDRESSIERGRMVDFVAIHADYFKPGQPFFPASGTGGTLRSPFPEMTDAEYWLLHMLYGSAEETRYFLSECTYLFLGKTVVEALSQEATPHGRMARWLRDSSTSKDPSFPDVWYALTYDQRVWSRARQLGKEHGRVEEPESAADRATWTRLPPELQSLLATNFPNRMMRRRALLAPWAGNEQFTVWNERACWSGHDPKTSGTRAYLTKCLAENAEYLTPDKPFLPSEGTRGTLRSPFPELSDAEYWMFYAMFNDAADTRHHLTEVTMKWNSEREETIIEYLRKGQVNASSGETLVQLVRHLGRGKPKRGWVSEAWDKLHNLLTLDPGAQ